MQNLNKHIQPDRDLFGKLRPLLEEMVYTLKSRYLQSNIENAKATLEVGLDHDRTVWTVEPISAKPGYIVSKIQSFYQEREADSFLFANEPETMEYLVKEIVEKIVYCRCWFAEKDVKLKPGSYG